MKESNRKFKNTYRLLIAVSTGLLFLSLFGIIGAFLPAAAQSGRTIPAILSAIFLFGVPGIAGIFAYKQNRKSPESKKAGVWLLITGLTL